jgi:hypothetical protein
MHPDDLPVVDGEVLLRRVPNTSDRFTFPDGPFLFVAFLPNQGDPGGLSLFRHGPAYVANARDLLDVAENPVVRHFGGVASVTAAQVRAVGADPEPKRDDTGLRGHCEVPAMSYRLYKQSKADKNRIRDMADRLARVALVVVAPKPKPDPEA